jgi:hypothetical protein
VGASSISVASVEWKAEGSREVRRESKTGGAGKGEAGITATRTKLWLAGTRQSEYTERARFIA